MTQLMTYQEFENLENSFQYVFVNRVLRTADGMLYLPYQEDKLEMDEIEYEVIKSEKGIVKLMNEEFTQEDLSQLINKGE